MTKLSDQGFSESLGAYLTDPRHSETSVMWCEEVDGVFVLCTRCTVCGAENRATYDQLAEQGPTLTHTSDCAADRINSTLASARRTPLGR